MDPALTALRDAEYDEAGAGWIIDRDRHDFAEDDAELPSRAGVSGPRTRPMDEALYTLRFRLFDDDGELYYSGRLIDDDECVSQVAALEYGATDAGCTTIKVLRGTRWVEEVG